jgi:hypothetical protein
VRAEEKELEGPELAREPALEVVEEVSREDEEELPVFASEEVVDVELAHRSRVLDALALILSGAEVNISLLYLPKRETEALEFLKTAVTGHDTNLGNFVYAEDRALMLEQSLAVLQQNLTHGSAAELGELHGQLDRLTERLGDLREQLRNLEDAQDDLERAPETVTKAETDEDDKPAPVEEEDSLTGFLASALNTLAKVSGAAPPKVSTLEGPERPESPKPPTTLAGDAVAEAPKPPSTLSEGPAIAATPPRLSTLDGPELPEVTKPTSTLSGPEVVDEEPQRSTLYSEGLTRALIEPPEPAAPEPPAGKPKNPKGKKRG